MKYAFIVNPIAGTGKGKEALISQISKLAAEDDRDICCYRTEGVEDAAVLAGSIAAEAAEIGENVHIYACGGDGTANEIANSLAGYPNAKFGIIPNGSGNDFVRAFDDFDSFMDIEKQLDAKPVKIDLLKYSYMRDGKRISRYCVNGINIGFDGNTAILAGQLKQMPGVSGTFSYLLSVGMNLLEKRGQDLRVTADGELIHEGPLLMCTVSNGRFCGGGIESCPHGKVDDGKAELFIVNEISRTAFIKAFPAFKAGKFFELENGDELAKYRQPFKVEISPKKKPMQFVVDGEKTVTGDLTVEVCHDAIEFLIQ